MKSLIKYIFIFAIGILVGLLLLKKSQHKYRTQQIDIISNGIKNISRLIVTEASYSEIYNYQDAEKYFFETIEFEKKVILLVNAKIQVSYDLKQLEIAIDSTHKKMIITYIPEEELTIIPDFKYYDFQQSMWNTFTKEELNEIQQNSIDKLVTTAEVSEVKLKARKQLLKEIQSLLKLAKLVDWTVEDQTQDHELNIGILSGFKD